MVKAEALESFASALLVAHGVAPDQAGEVAANAVWSELIGRPNFGVSRFPIYLKRVGLGVMNPAPRFSFERLSPSLGRLNGDNGFGHAAAAAAMRHAIALARETGAACVGVHNSNFFGAGAYFVQQAAAAGMISLAMSNSFPKVAAHGGRSAVFGTNPLAFGAPRRNGESILFDLATSALAGSTVREHIERGLALPAGFAIDAAGVPITDPKRVNEGALLPFGGAKGYGFGLLVEILAGVLTGAGISYGVASMYENFERSGDNGHFFIVLDAARLLGRDPYFDRLDALIGLIKLSNSSSEVLLPGEIRWQNLRENQANGIAIDQSMRRQLTALATAKGVAVPW